MSLSMGRSLEAHRSSSGGRSIFARVSAPPAPGHSPPVVLAHGLVVSSRYLAPTAELLGRSFSVFAPDLPGFGRSEKPRRPLSLTALADALGDWIESMGLGRVSLLGNSMGCQVVVELAVRRPELVSRLVLQGPTVDPAARSTRHQMKRWLENMPYEKPGLGPIMASDYARAGLRRALRTFGELLRDPIEEKLPHVRAPVMVVCGSEDPISPEAWGARVAQLVPDGRLRVIPGGGHTLVYSMPLELERVARPFLLAEPRIPAKEPD
jgi:2-hydroxy-6-oxonona-2,4-dienedioate hydrolase